MEQMEITKKDALDKAYHILSNEIREYASIHSIPEKELKHLIDSVIEAYVEKKAVFYMEERLCKFQSRLNGSLNFTLRVLGSNSSQKDCSIAYTKHLKQLITND
ncbi:MAG: hypothetical protein LBQ39_01995 [Tannerellaceae bacterium]|jgi:hypothetical protein|nr:hypothetical protein [Tannerellaceae bacterium]